MVKYCFNIKDIKIKCSMSFILPNELIVQHMYFAAFEQFAQ